MITDHNKRRLHEYQIVDYAMKSPAISCEWNGRVSIGRGVTRKVIQNNDGSIRGYYVDRNRRSEGTIEMYCGELRPVSTDFRSCDWSNIKYSDEMSKYIYVPIPLEV